MKVYLIAGNISWLDEAPETFDAVWDITPAQEAILRDDGTADYRDGRLVIIPHAAETVEASNKGGLTRLEFMNRFTDTELATIYTVAKTNVAVEIWLAKFSATAPDEFGFSVYLNDPRTIESVTMLEQAGLLAAGRAQEILS